MKAEHKVWLIDEGHAGHRVQSEGIVQAIERAGFRVDVARIDSTPKLRGVLRPAARAIFARLDGPGAVRFARRVTDFRDPGGPRPSFIISSGGRTAFASRALALYTGAPNVFVGNPKPFPHDWFSAVLSPIELPQGEAILTGIVPNLVTPELCAEQAHRYWRGPPPPKLWTMLIGGPSRNHLYDVQDWRDIAHGITTLARRHGIRWLISTSRRTGADAEAILEQEIAPEAVEELVLYGKQPRRVVQPFLGSGEVIFVTRDSLTMVSEAIMSARPVVGVLPRRIELDPANFMARVLRKYASWPQYSEITCAELGQFAGPANLERPGRHQASEELDQAVEHLASALKMHHLQSA